MTMPEEVNPPLPHESFRVVLSNQSPKQPISQSPRHAVTFFPAPEERNIYRPVCTKAKCGDIRKGTEPVLAGFLPAGSKNRDKTKKYRDTLKLTRHPQRPELWDGNTAGRYVEAIVGYQEKG